MANSKQLDSLNLENQLREEREILCSILSKWLPNRREIRRQLLLLADELNKHQKNVNIAQVTGTSTSIVGTGLIIGGFAASFFTFGVSLIISGVGAGIAGVGGLTTAGAGITNAVLTKKICKRAQKAIDRDQELTQQLRSCLKRLERQIQYIRKNEKLYMSCKEKMFLSANVGSCLKSIGKNLVADLVITGRLAANTANLGADTAVTVFKTMTTTTAKVIHIGGFVVGMAMVPLDVYTLVTSSISLHKGNTSDAENKIRKIINDMMCPEEEVSGIVESILQEMLVSAA